MQIQSAITRKTIAGRSIRWNEELAASAYENGYWIHETLADKLKTLANETPNKVLIIEGNTRLTAQSLYERATHLANAFLDRYPVGSVISFMLPNWHEAAEIYLGATLAGMIAHPILPSLREHDLCFMLKDVESRMLFVPETFRKHDYVAMLERVKQAMEAAPDVCVVRGESDKFIPYGTLFNSQSNTQMPTVDANAVRMIMYTSGTTGSPKGVMHNHNSIHALIKQIGNHWQVENEDKFLVASPISHIGGSIYAFECPILLGATAILMEHWDADSAVDLIQKHECTHFAGATPFLAQTLASARKADSRLPSLKVFICGGASVPASLIYEANDYFERASVTRVYGSTEVPVMTVGAFNDVKHAAETDGAPGIATVALSESSSSTTDTGEVIAMGPQMLVGYVHNQDEARVFDENGYFRTGDLGRWEDDHYLVIAGRAKDIIIRHGENIAPKEIEDLLVVHPDINEIAIVGLPDNNTGERACAVIVPNGQAQPTLSDLSALLTEKGVAKFKYPEQVELWDALPKNDAGKVLKHQIRNTLLEQNKEAV